MANIDKHATGSFCWIELGTSDQDAAKTFYASLFGWTPNDYPMGPNGFYTMFSLDGRNAAAAYTLGPEERERGVPPHWMLYVATESADESAKRATDAGGKVLAGPFDVYTFGRMAVIQGITGAVISVWQPMSHPGIGIKDVDGTLCWADLSTPDPARAREFLPKVFGWSIEPGENDTSGYLHIKNGEQFIGGVQSVQHRNPNAPPHWLAYFLVSDADASTEKVKALGGNVLMPPMTMENVGRWSIVSDPQGAVFAVFQSTHQG